MEPTKEEFYQRQYTTYRQSLQHHACKILYHHKKKFHQKLFETRFIAFFGVSVHVATEIYLDIKWMKLPLQRMVHRLWNLHWLKGYPPERQAAPIFGISETTWRTTVKSVTENVISKLDQVCFFSFSLFFFFLFSFFFRSSNFFLKR